MFPYKFSLLFYTNLDKLSKYLLLSVDDCCYINYLMIYHHVHINQHPARFPFDLGYSPRYFGTRKLVPFHHD